MTNPRLSLVIPAYNEAARLPAMLTAVADFCADRDDHVEVVLVDDGSEDGTSGLALPPATPRIEWRWLRNERNRGKGFSVRRGMLAARGALRLFTDADLSFPLCEVSKLESAPRGGADLAIGSRALTGAGPRAPELMIARDSRLRQAGSCVFNLVVRQVLDLPFRDTQSGFKLFTHACAEAVFARQRIEGWGFDPEILYLAGQLGFRTVEVPVACAHVEGSKIRFLRDSSRMFADVVSIRRAHAHVAMVAARPAVLPVAPAVGVETETTERAAA